MLCFFFCRLFTLYLHGSHLSLHLYSFSSEIRKCRKGFNKEEERSLCDLMAAHMSGVETRYVFLLLFTYVVFTRLPSTVFPRCLRAACVKCFFQKLQDVRNQEMSEDFNMEQERSAHDVSLCDVFLLLFFLLALSTWLPFHCLDFFLSAKLQYCFVDEKTSPEPPRAEWCCSIWVNFSISGELSP